jgi:ribose transport system substrate-binding protein
MQDWDLTRSSQGRRRTTRLMWSMAAAAAALALSACGSSSSSSSATSSSAATSSTASSAGATSASSSSSACLSQAKQIVDAAEQPITAKPPTQPIQMSKLKGKLVYFIGVGSGYSLRLATDFNIAAHAAGLEPVIFNGATPTDWNTGIQQAVSRHAAGIAMEPIVPQLVVSSTAQAKAAGIPVVNSNSIPPPPTNITVNQLVPTDSGKQLAAYAAIQSNCKVNAVLPLDPAFIGLVAIANSAIAEFKQLCPSTCTAKKMPLNIATLATQAGPAIQEALQRDPSINAVIPTFDTIALLMAPSIAQSGSKAKLYSEDGDDANLALVRKGLQAADYSYAPTEYEAYVMVDTLARAMLKMPAAPPPVQFQLFTTANIPASSSFAALWPKLVGFQATYMKLWGLS